MDRRILKSDLFKVQDAIKFEVRDADEDESLDKSISDVTLDKVTDKTLDFSVNFKDPKSITTNILEPDVLEIYLLLPQLIVDAENL